MLQSLLTASIEFATVASIAYFSLMFVVGFATRARIVPDMPQPATEADTPIAADESADEPAEEPVSYAAATIAPAAVLVVEDEPAAVKVMTRREALAIAKEHKIPNYSRMDTAALREAVEQVLNG